MKPSRLLRALARSHRWLGLGAVLFMLWLAVTGALVNHAGDFGFARETIRSRWLLDAYNIGAPPVSAAHRVGARWLVQAERSLYLDDRFVTMLGDDEQLLGAVAAGGLYAVATGTQLRLLDPAGELVETLGPAHGLPEAPRALGVSARGQLAVRARAGLFVADPVELRWQRQAVPARWSAAEPLPAALQATIERDARARVLTREQLVRDLHSGRFFGVWAKWLSDLAALALVALSLSGMWLWWRARKEFPKRSVPGSNGKPRG